MISDMKKTDSIVIFTDGASKGNPGKGGWGTIVATPEIVTELGGAKANTTNNEMELLALLEGLRNVKSQDQKIKVYMDSKYVMNGVNRWVASWKANGWMTKAKTPVTHQGLWEDIDTFLEVHDVEIIHIPGHSGIAGNERVDEIASNLAEGKDVTLYKGSLEGYGVDLANLSVTHEKKKGKSNSGKKAYSYVSCVNGDVQIHATWAETEKRVKGTSGARFKKSFSPSDEKDIIETYKKL